MPKAKPYMDLSELNGRDLKAELKNINQQQKDINLRILVGEILLEVADGPIKINDKADYEKIFDKLDKDGNGKINFSEISKIAKDVSPKRFEQAIKDHTNLLQRGFANLSNASIDKDFFVKGVMAYDSENAPSVYFDRGRDGSISPKDLKFGIATQKHMDAEFEATKATLNR